MNEYQGVWVAIATVFAAVFAWLAKTTHMLSNLSEKYVPREEVNRRFDLLRADVHRDFAIKEKRDEKRFDQIDAKLDRILDELKQKVDKNGR